ncbi:hypothetical protein Tco_0389944 [Tanacetum coccineum]
MEVITQAAQIKDLKAQIKQLKKKAKLVISHHNAWIKSVSMKKRLASKKSLKTKLIQKEYVSKQGRKPAKSEPIVHKDLAFDDLDDAIDYMEPKDAHDKGTVKDSEETRVSTEEQVSTDKPKVSTDKPKVSTDKPNKGTAEPKDENSDESAAPTTIFRDDETIAQFLVTISQNKTKQKGFKIKVIKDTDRPRTITERPILTLKPLPKIDPKDKSKKVLEEKAESEGVNEAERKFALLVNDEEIARKTRFLLRSFKKKREKSSPFSKEPSGYRHAQLNKKKFEEIQVMYEKVKRANENFITIGSAKDEKLIEKMNKKSAGRRLKMKAPKRSKRQKTDSDHVEENQLRTFLKIVPEEEEKIDYEVLGTRVHVLRLEDGTEINMLAERRYPLTKNTLERMIDLKLTGVSDDDIVFDLLRFIKQHIDEFGGQDRNEEDL